MSDEQKRQPERDQESKEPFEQSGSGEDYDPNGNWAAERRLDQGSGTTVPGMEGAPTGAGDGGFGPEGDYSDPASERDREAGANVNAARDAVAKEAQGRNSELPNE